MSRSKYWRGWAARHGGLCALCGRPFHNNGAISREHLIPQCHGGTDGSSLPAHMACNMWRSNASLVRVMSALSLSVTRDERAFDKWANSATRAGGRKIGDPPNLTPYELIAAVGMKRRYAKLVK